jgi:hypothetical protein
VCICIKISSTISLYWPQKYVDDAGGIYTLTMPIKDWSILTTTKTKKTQHLKPTTWQLLLITVAIPPPYRTDYDLLLESVDLVLSKI